MTATAALSQIQTEYLALTRRRRLYGGVLLILLVAIFVTGFRIADARNAGGFWHGLNQVGDFPADLVTEAFQKAAHLPGHLLDALPALIETLNIALVATLPGCVAGTAPSLAATRGLAHWPWLVQVARRLCDICRAIPEIVIALVLIFILGGGPVPAVIAIAIHTAGAMGEVLFEVNENVDLGSVEGLASVGANWSQRMWLGVFPQVAPNYLSYGLMRIEINIDASAILGFVGAGGLGYELGDSMTFGQGKFDQAAAIFLLLFAPIVVVDQISGVLRHRLTHGATA